MLHIELFAKIMSSEAIKSRLICAMSMRMGKMRIYCGQGKFIQFGGVVGCRREGGGKPG